MSSHVHTNISKAENFVEMIEDLLKDKPILLFDGVCNLCNSSIQFVIHHDPDSLIKFASLQSETGQILLSYFNIVQNKEMPESVILIENGKFYVRSEAALRTLKIIRGPNSWWLRSLFWVPLFIRDWIYNMVSRNRYKWFGREDSCMIPTAELKARFLN